MRSESLIADHAMALGKVILGIVSPCLREEEWRDAFGEFVKAAKEMLLRYEERRERMLRNVRPSINEGAS